MNLIRRNSSWLPNNPSFFDDYVTRIPFDWRTSNYSSTNTTLPAINISENDDQYLVEMAAPGMDKKDFDIELKDHNVLVISSEREDTTQAKNGEQWLRREYSYESFQRSFQFNHTKLDEAHIQASYDDGMLRVRIPKQGDVKTKPTKRIPIS